MRLPKVLLAVFLMAGQFQLSDAVSHATSASALETAGIEPTGELTVSAAASLTESFTALGRQFRQRHPKVRIRFNFASTSSLVAQVQSGAPVDLFASADMSSQDRLAASGHIVRSPRVFARNTMQIAVKPGNPLGVRGVGDLSRVGVVALCNATVPCGIYAAAVLRLSNTVLPTSMITRAIDVKAALTSVSFGDADAAIVYATDVKAAGKAVQGVVIPSALNVKAMYGLSVIRGSTNHVVAQQFVDFVLSPNGRATLKEFGFLAP